MGGQKAITSPDRGGDVLELAVVVAAFYDNAVDSPFDMQAPKEGSGSEGEQGTEEAHRSPAERVELSLQDRHESPPLPAR